MFDFIMTKEQKKLRDEARAFTKWVPKQLILDMCILRAYSFIMMTLYPRMAI